MLKPQSLPLIARLALAVAATGAAALVAWLMPGAHETPYFAIFVLAVLVSSWYGGWPGGLFSVVLSVLSVAYLIAEPAGLLAINSVEDVIRLAAFLVVALLVCGFTSAVRARTAAREALLAAEEHYRTLFEKSPLPMWVYDLESLRFLAVNEAAIEHYGYSGDEFLSMTIKDIRPEEDIPAALLADVRKPAPRLGFSGIWRHRKKDGTLIQVEITSQGILWEGRAARLAFAADVTERKQAEEALRESESKFRALADTVTCAIIVYQGEHFWYVNRRAQEFTGYTEQEFLRMRFWEIVHPDFREEIRQRGFARQRGEAVPSRYELCILTKHGESRWLDVSATRVEYEGESAGLLTAVDITERKRAEREIRESHERFEFVTRATNDAVWDWDLVTNGVCWNEAVCTLFGYARDQVGPDADWWIAQIHPDDRDRVATSIHRVIEGTGQFWSDEYRYRRADGSYADILDRGYVLRDADGKPVRMIGAMQDITYRKRAEDALKDSEVRYRLMVEGSEQVFFYVHDPEHRFEYLSPSVKDVLGYDPEELLGQPYDVLLTGLPDDAIIQEMTDGALRDGQRRQPYTVAHRHKDGRVVALEIVETPIKREGRVVGIQGFARDVTERKHLEDQFRQAQKMEAVGRLAGGVAHDFNNLLMVIGGYAEILRDRCAADESLRKDVDEILRATERATTLTRQLLAFSRRQVLELKVLNLNDVVADVEKLLRRLIGEDIELVTRLAPHLGSVKADPSQIEQVLMNLAINARDAMPRGGRLLIETSNVQVDAEFARRHVGLQPGAWVTISVTDTGRGMDADTLAHVFEPFFTTKEKGAGTGLGLATVYGIVKQSGGYISMYSEPGQGTTFTVYLPRTDQTVGAETSVRPAPTANGGRETILLVEDEAGVRDLSAEILRAKGYTILAAANADEALNLAGQHPGTIHLLLTDVVLPGMRGVELAEHLGALRPGIKVVYMSGYTEDAFLHQGDLPPGTAFLQKPFSAALLTRKIREVLDAA
jgi:PAS domain S-box-containing protein